MATENYESSSLGSGYSDASDMIPDGPVSGLTAGNSMAGGNVISDTPSYTAPGSVSEQTAAVETHMVGPVES